MPEPTPFAATESATDLALTDLPLGTPARVLGLRMAHAEAPAELHKRLAELGFLPGEAVRVVARGFLSREPLAVRIGTGTFALRRFEAACVRVTLEPVLAG